MSVGSSFVADASVAVKWLIPEQHTDEALRLHKAAALIAVPDFVYAEVGNVLWKHVRRELISEAEARSALNVFEQLSSKIAVYPSRGLLPSALELACHTGASVYDSLYLALAREQQRRCVTADRKLFDRISQTPFAEHMQWIGD